jgi:alpha-glucosidase
MIRLRWFILFTVIALTYKAGAAESCLTLKSPSGRISVSVFHEGKGSFSYSVKKKRQILIQPSLLGLSINERSFFIDDVCPVIISSSIKNSRSNFLVGFGGSKMEFVLSEEGCAFRYLLPLGENRVNEEQTEFAVDGSYSAWFFERKNAWKLKSYAGWWTKTKIDSLATISPEGPVQGKPIVIELPKGKYLFIAEAALANYSGMRFRCVGNKLQVDFTEGKKGFQPRALDIGSTPWRVIGVADDLNALVNTQLIRDLNPAPDPVLYSDKSYIQEGRSVWSWITKNENYLQPAYEKKFIDAAAELKFEYTLIDAGWEEKWANKWGMLTDIVNYAAKKNVKVWVWKDSKQLKDTLYRNRFLDSLQRLGVVGIKVDFMNSEAMELINFEIDFLKSAAQRRLMVDFHGCHTSTGEYITYPNEMTREGIRGAELNTMNEYIPAWHNAALPFTRFITGPADYTPGLFSNKGATTYTHQLALLYLFNSPFQCIAENPITLLNDPKYKPIIPLLTILPVSWDETIVLPGSKIGALAIIAKRKGNDWYVAAINGAATPAKCKIDYSFLPKNEKFSGEIVMDKEDGFQITKTSVASGSRFKTELLGSGGMLIHLKRF